MIIRNKFNLISTPYKTDIIASRIRILPYIFSITVKPEDAWAGIKSFRQKDRRTKEQISFADTVFSFVLLPKKEFIPVNRV